MVGPKRKYKPVQGGFLVLRPNMTVYDEFVDIIKKGDFRERGGWGGVVGPFYGSMTFQGIIPYYYDYLNMHQAVELNRCVYNQMADNPKDKRTVNDIPQGRCRTDEEECEDCRNRDISEVVSSHFTLCQSKRARELLASKQIFEYLFLELASLLSSFVSNSKQKSALCKVSPQ